MTEQTKKFIDENPNWLNTQYATTRLGYQLELVLTKMLVEGVFLRKNPFPSSRLSVKKTKCNICGAELLRRSFNGNKPVCMTHKMERRKKAGLIHKAKKKNVWYNYCVR